MVKTKVFYLASLNQAPHDLNNRLARPNRCIIIIIYNYKLIQENKHEYTFP